MLEHGQEIIATYGYVIVFLWAFIEGEMGMLLAGSVAQQGYLSYPLVALTAFLGGFFGDQFYFWLGRHYGDRIFQRFPRFAAPSVKARQLLERYNTPFILTNRFMYGVRIAGPIVVGTTNIPALKFLVLNMISAIAWAITVTGLGYMFAHAVGLVAEDMHTVQQVFLGLLLVVIVVAWFLHTHKQP